MIRSLTLALLFLAHVASAATYYLEIGHGGSNSGTQANPWTSWASVTQGSLNPGDVVYIARGTGASYGSASITAAGNDRTVAGRVWFIGTGNALAGTGPVFTGFSSSTDYIGLVNVEITSGSTAKTGTALSWGGNGVTGWLVQDCYIHHKSSGIITSNGHDNNYNVIRGVYFQDLNDQGSSQIELHGHHNVVEYTHMGRGADRLRPFQYLSVFRNAYHTAMLQSDLTGTDPHIDDAQIYRSGLTAPFWSDKNIVEAIFARDSATGHAHFLQLRDDSLSGDYRGLIARLNVVYNTNSLGENQNMANERGYNNTIIDLTTGGNLSRWFRNAGVTAADNIWINNSFTRANANSGSVSPLYTSNGASITAEHNHEYLSGNLQGSNNVEDTDPLFQSEDPDTTGFVVPQSGSPLRGAQRPQTYANGSGSNSTALVVDDADFFTDGWGIVEGDLIIIGAGSPVRISAIDYTTEAITLASARSWSDNDTVYLFGTNDAIGAYGYRASGYAIDGAATLANPSGNNWTVTPADSDLVRMVIFYEDGIPQAPDYDSPYTYTSGGGEVTANIYARFASQEPIIAALSGAGSAPTAPSDLVATAVSFTQIGLVWSDNSSDETSFAILRGTSSGSLTEITTVAPNTETYSDTGLTEGTTYYYAIVARNGNGDSAESNEDSATTLSGPSATGNLFIGY